jgi:hypothetical protein
MELYFEALSRCKGHIRPGWDKSIGACTSILKTAILVVANGNLSDIFYHNRGSMWTAKPLNKTD